MQKGPKPKYPFAALKIGQSFFVPATDAQPHSLRVYAYQQAKRYGMKLSVSISEEGTRIKRVDPTDADAYRYAVE